MGDGGLTRSAAACSRRVSRKYLATLWEILNDGKNYQWPIAQLREQWDALPVPVPADKSSTFPIAKYRELRDWIVAERKKRKFTFPPVMIPQLNETTQPGVLWKNRLIADHRRQGTLTDEEKQNEDLRLAIERFCDVFPDYFYADRAWLHELSVREVRKGTLAGCRFSSANRLLPRRCAAVRHAAGW